MCSIDDTWGAAGASGGAECSAFAQIGAMRRTAASGTTRTRFVNYSDGTRSARNVGAWPRTISTGTERPGVNASTTFANVAGESIS